MRIAPHPVFEFTMHASVGMLRALNVGKQNPATTPRHKRAKDLQDRSMTARARRRPSI